MSEEEKREEEAQPASAKELFERNQKEIIKRKEGYYDKVIDSLKLTKTKLDILVVVLLIIIVLIFVFGSKN